MSLVAALRCATAAGWPWSQSAPPRLAASLVAAWPVTVWTTLFTASWTSGDEEPMVTVAAPSTTAAATAAPFDAESRVNSFASIRPSLGGRQANEHVAQGIRAARGPGRSG